MFFLGTIVKAEKEEEEVAKKKKIVCRRNKYEQKPFGEYPIYFQIF